MSVPAVASRPRSPNSPERSEPKSRRGLVSRGQIQDNATVPVEELGGDPFAFDPDRVVRSELAELDRSPLRREILGQSAFDQLAQHRMEPADRPGPSRAELVMATRQQPQHQAVILELD